MEAYTVFMDWMNQHHQNVPTTQSNLYIQCNSYQDSNDIFPETRTNISKIYMEPEKAPHSNSNPEKKE